MASLIKDPQSGIYRIAFRFGGKQFTRSLKTTDLKVASAIRWRVEEMIALLMRGLLVIPEDAEPGTYILSDGKLARKPILRTPTAAVKTVTIGDLVTLYDTSLPEGTKESSSLTTERIHRRNVARVLGENTPLASFDLAMAQRYIKARLGEKYGKNAKRPIQAYTARKELKSFRHAWVWCHEMKLVPVYPTWELRRLRIPKDREREPFRTMAQVREILDRGGVKPEDEKRLWDGLYLTGEELRKLLDHVGSLETDRFVYPMFAFAVYTGARRSEMMRSRRDDFDFRAGSVRLREKKRKRDEESTRSVDLHPALERIMKDWFARHPGGQFTLARDDVTPLDADTMDNRFESAIRGTEWAVMRGFHVLRHSFASALAAAGVDQRVIDAFMGHQTEEMAKLYQHLRPDKLKDAILALGI